MDGRSMKRYRGRSKYNSKGGLRRRFLYNGRYVNKRKYRKKTNIMKAEYMIPFSGSLIPRQLHMTASFFTTVQTIAPVSINPSTAGPTFGHFSFALSDLDQVASFSAIFDQYKFVEVEILFVPAQTVNTIQTVAANSTNPFLYVVVDRDDATNLASTAAAREYDNCQIINCTSGLKVRLRPNYTRAIYAAGVFSGYEICDPIWLDMANTGIPHFGVKYACDGINGSSTQQIGWSTIIHYKIAFRNIR